jgi:hypothetical protein
MPGVPEMVWRTLGAGDTGGAWLSGGDEALIPLREQVLDWLFSDDYLGTFCKIHALRRFHASIDGNALWALLSLGPGDERANALRGCALDSGPTDGWNCDRKARGLSSSFTESLIPLRALNLHAQTRRDTGSAAAEAGEFFLRRKLYRRLTARRHLGLRSGAGRHARYRRLHRQPPTAGPAGLSLRRALRRPASVAEPSAQKDRSRTVLGEPVRPEQAL